MLKGIDKILTGDILKALSDMGHGDELVIADANFPAESNAKRIIRVPGVDSTLLLKAIMSVFPIDTYSSEPAIIMDLTDSDKAKGMNEPVIWEQFLDILKMHCNEIHLTKTDRFDFYEKAKKAYLIIQCGEERQYGNLILSKGVVID